MCAKSTRREASWQDLQNDRVFDLAQIQKSYGEIYAAHLAAMHVVDSLYCLHEFNGDCEEVDPLIKAHSVAHYGYLFEGDIQRYNELFRSADVWPIFSRATAYPVGGFGELEMSYHAVVNTIAHTTLWAMRHAIGCTLLETVKDRDSLTPSVITEHFEAIHEHLSKLELVDRYVLEIHLDKEFERAGGDLVAYRRWQFDAPIYGNTNADDSSESRSESGGDVNGLNELKPRQKELVAMIAEHKRNTGRRMTGPEIMGEFARLRKQRQGSAVRGELSHLKQLGWLVNISDDKGKGYDLGPEYHETGMPTNGR